ncbi:MAG TPA: hypothetical protein VG267_01910 [Terracidiphilus sp.]|jgi:hypothetical protein|nr:hypothetical protein [Terracidiphilus sp.]
MVIVETINWTYRSRHPMLQMWPDEWLQNIDDGFPEPTEEKGRSAYRAPAFFFYSLAGAGRSFPLGEASNLR